MTSWTKSCKTCRARKIKCDEQQPTCWNCTKARRICQRFNTKISIDASSTAVIEVVQDAFRSLRATAVTEEARKQLMTQYHAAVSDLRQIVMSEKAFIPAFMLALFEMCVDQGENTWQTHRLGCLAILRSSQRLSPLLEAITILHDIAVELEALNEPRKIDLQRLSVPLKRAYKDLLICIDDSVGLTVLLCADDLLLRCGCLDDRKQAQIVQKQQDTVEELCETSSQDLQPLSATQRMWALYSALAVLGDDLKGVQLLRNELRTIGESCYLPKAAHLALLDEPAKISYALAGLSVIAMHSMLRYVDEKPDFVG